MDIEQLHSAVSAAFGRRDYVSCFQMLDSFLATATGADRGRALNMKANLLLCEPRRAPEGLALVDEAFELLHSDPEHSLKCLINALALCMAVGDVEKAGIYEAFVHPLLQQHSSHPGIRNLQSRIYINLGDLANRRGQHPTAYWHFVQAVACLEQTDIPQDQVRTLLLISYLHVANTCTLMGRGPEAAEALDKARPLISSSNELARWTMHRANLLRSQRRYHEAQHALNTISVSEVHWPAGDQARYHLERALLFQDLGDIRHFHSHLANARQIAEENCEEFLLCEIQRVQRSPIMEVVK